MGAIVFWVCPGRDPNIEPTQHSADPELPFLSRITFLLYTHCVESSTLQANDVCLGKCLKIKLTMGLFIMHWYRAIVFFILTADKTENTPPPPQICHSAAQTGKLPKRMVTIEQHT